jgi:hypothetical protein
VVDWGRDFEAYVRDAQAAILAGTVGGMRLRLSDLRLLPPLLGRDQCRCLICTIETDQGWVRAPSEAFNAWDIVRAETGAFCEWCWALLKDPRTRKSSWIGRPGRIEFYDGAHLAEIATWLRSPELPAVVSLTISHRRVRWLTLGQRVSVSPTTVWVATDWIGPVLLDTTDQEPLALAERLLARGVRRTTLRTGQPTPREWADALAGGWQDDLESARHHAGDPRWEVWVHVAPKPRTR